MMMATDTRRVVAPTPAGGSLDKIQGPAGPGGRKRGRPRGSRSVSRGELPVVTLQPPSRCPVCQGSRRGRYYSRRVQIAAGHAEDGQPYGRIVSWRCRCLDCGQVRIDREFR